MLPESRLYSFIDQNNGFTLHFLEGQKLINDLAIIHEVTGEGFHFYRDNVLALQHMISYLKPDEALGIYLESEDPYFRLNIELNEHGQMRTLLLPEDFKIFPKMMTGRCRFVKLSPGNKPYTSIIPLENALSSEVVNKILNDSYQVKSNVFISDLSDQSLMIRKLPNKNVDKIEQENTTTINEYWNFLKSATDHIFEQGIINQDEIQAAFEKKGLLFLGSKEIQFKCTCSEQRMFDGVRSIIISQGIDSVFAPDEDFIEAKCDYCKTVYPFKRGLFLN